MTRLPVQPLIARVKSAGLAILIVAALPSIAFAQPAAASALKAAFTLNFVKFTEWPDLKPGLPILVCVYAEDSIADALTQVMRNQAVGGHAIRLVRIAPDAAVRDCQVLLVTEREPRRFAAILEQAGRFPVLTVSDVEQSAKHGAIIEFFQESGRLRFAINLDTMERSRIKVSSRLLSLAKVVRDADTP
jgi:hypothetical protein